MYVLICQAETALTVYHLIPAFICFGVGTASAVVAFVFENIFVFGVSQGRDSPNSF
jgi:ABC-type proline/glycine betaine transport system permease subunit